ncbi:MAG: GWxTD domain-containing protein [Candidatus Aminicenantes bacterium]|nr:GWxTD domain-containing protein [Candidatus Aminicenantes bacterium]
MKKIRPIKAVIILNLIILSILSLLFGRSELSVKHQEWLDLIKPIITPIEREVFLKLRTDQERERFIIFFWKQRDPRPDTEVNEFYQEYMDRVTKADLLFTAGSGRKGSLTQRGYYFLLLGPPLERQLFLTHSGLWPLELWFYKGEEKYGLPPYFYLIFYQPQGQGDYRLFLPGIDGPEKLIIPSLNRANFDRQAAYNFLRQISPELANASLSFIPGAQLSSANPLSSETLLASLRSLPEKKFNEAYARHYLDYQGLVEVDYADRYIESNFRGLIFLHQGQPFFHWTFEPTVMSFSEEKAQVIAFYDLIIKIEDRQAKTLWQHKEEISVRLTREEFENQGKRIFAFQDLFPLIPGKYRLYFLLKNKTVKEFSSASWEVEIPNPGPKPSLSQPLIYFSREERPQNQQSLLQAFSFGPWLYRLNARAEIPASTKIGLVIQIWPSLTNNIEARALKITIRRAADNSIAKTWEENIDKIRLIENILDTGFFSLDDLKADYYFLEVSLLGPNHEILATKKEKIIKLNHYYQPNPRVFSRLHPAFPNIESQQILATQYFLSGQYQEALKLSEAILKVRDDPESRLLIGKILFALKRYQESLNFLIPLYEKSQNREVAKVIVLNWVNLREWDKAITLLNKLLQEATELTLLNLLAECYLQLNQPEKALPWLKKSLELDPDQPQIKKLQEEIKAKIK